MKEPLIYGLHTVEALLNSTPEKIKILLLQSGRNDIRIKNIIMLAEQLNISIQYIAKEKLDALLLNANHQGVAAKTIKIFNYSENDLNNILSNTKEPPLLLILDGVQDPHNLGACLRSANAAGVDIVITPKNNVTGITSVVRKVASGAAETTPFIQVTNLARTLTSLKNQGIWVYGADSSAKKNIYNNDWCGPVALVLGGEGKGLRRLTREYCDELVSIPMFGTIASLNVSVATGICLFEVVRQRYSSK
jgi:23S rRNA (guanosine2251-2'-O)-methyltransferase